MTIFILSSRMMREFYCLAAACRLFHHFSNEKIAYPSEHRLSRPLLLPTIDLDQFQRNQVLDTKVQPVKSLNYCGIQSA